MSYQQERFEKLASLAEQYAPQEGPNYTCIEGFGVWKSSSITQRRTPVVDLPAIWIVAQGKKICYIGGREYDYSAGNALVLFYPMAMEMEIIEASSDRPFMAAGVAIDLVKLADVLLHIDRIDDSAVQSVSTDPSGIFSIPLNDKLMEPYIRLFEALENPTDAAMLSASIVEEIY